MKENEKHLSDVRYLIFGSAFAWVPLLYFFLTYLVFALDLKKAMGGDAFILFLLLASAFFLLWAISTLWRSGRESRWIFVTLNTIILLICLWFLFLVGMTPHGT